MHLISSCRLHHHCWSTPPHLKHNAIGSNNFWESIMIWECDLHIGKWGIHLNLIWISICWQSKTCIREVGRTVETDKGHQQGEDGEQDKHEPEKLVFLSLYISFKGIWSHFGFEPINAWSFRISHLSTTLLHASMIMIQFRLMYLNLPPIYSQFAPNLSQFTSFFFSLCQFKSI